MAGVCQCGATGAGEACDVDAGHLTAVTCTGDLCTLTCANGHEDCNADPTDGCEVNITTVTNCGTCGTTCPTGALCTSGECRCGATGTGDVCSAQAGHLTAATCTLEVCTLTCESGYDDCNKDPSDGCEAVVNDTNNCGGCGVVCADKGTCVAGICRCGADASASICFMGVQGTTCSGKTCKCGVTTSCTLPAECTDVAGTYVCQ